MAAGHGDVSGLGVAGVGMHGVPGQSEDTLAHRPGWIRRRDGDNQIALVQVERIPRFPVIRFVIHPLSTKQSPAGLTSAAVGGGTELRRRR